MKYTFALVLALLLAPLTLSLAAEVFLVEHGQPRAEIIIAEQPQRTVRLAAHELQTYVEKISGAKLPIATQPTSGVPVQVYVGRSTHTDRLKLTAEGLQAGAYRIVSGDHWLVLIGDDTEFTPIEPWAKSNSEIVSGKVQGEWEKIVGAPWGVPGILMYKHQLNVSASVGRPGAEPAPPNAAGTRGDRGESAGDIAGTATGGGGGGSIGGRQQTRLRHWLERRAGGTPPKVADFGAPTSSRFRQEMGKDWRICSSIVSGMRGGCGVEG